MARPQRNEHIPYVGRETFLISTSTLTRMRAFEDVAFGRLAMDIAMAQAAKHHFSLPILGYMPDHAHAVTVGLSATSDVRKFVYDWKRTTGFAWKQSGRGRLWQEGFWDNHLRRDESPREFIEYVLLNPVRAGLVQHASQYPLLGSTDYSIEELIAILESDVGIPDRRH